MNSRFVIDSFSLPISDQDILETENYVSVPAVIAAPGIQVYFEDGKEVRVLVPEETLTDRAWLESIAQAPVTDEHPPEPVTPDNVRRYQIGNVGDVVEYDSEKGVVVRMILRDRSAIQAVRSRQKTDTSPAYYADYDDTPGVDPRFGPYDRIQIRRRATNHVAHCWEGRGHQARLLLDSVDRPADLASAWSRIFQPTEDSMDKPTNISVPSFKEQIQGLRDVITFVEELRLDAKDKDQPTTDQGLDPQTLSSAKESLGQLTDVIGQLAAQRDQLNAQLEEMKGEFSAVLAQIQGQGMANNAAESDEAADPLEGGEAPAEDVKDEMALDSKFLDYYNERQRILEVAKRYEIDSLETKGNRQLQREVVEKHTSHLPDDRKLELDSAVAVRAAYRTIESLQGQAPQGQPTKTAWSFETDASQKSSGNPVRDIYAKRREEFRKN